VSEVPDGPDGPVGPDATTMGPERNPAASLDCPEADPTVDVPDVGEGADGSYPPASECTGMRDPRSEPLTDPFGEPLAPGAGTQDPVDGSDLPFGGQEEFSPPDDGPRLASPDDEPLPPLPDGPQSSAGPAGYRAFSR
jgi:hypothetical protein